VDEGLEAARVETDEARRMGLYQQTERHILRAAPWIPLFTGAELWLVSESVHGFTVPGIVRPRLADVWIADD
jgi:ABC-type transport system substrate-binding protein